jgi:acetyltransferase-like isoleucine patch superfamily enzyme
MSYTNINVGGNDVRRDLAVTCRPLEGDRDISALGDSKMLNRYRRSIQRYYLTQLTSLHFRLGLVQLLVGLIPDDNLSGLRAALYRWVFPNISKRVYISGKLSIRGEGDIYSRLRMGERATINAPCFIELNGPVTIGKGAALGNHVIIITGTHAIGTPQRRADYTLVPQPVTIGEGVWIGACSTISPGVTIGPSAFVTVGSIVTRDVPANAQVAGNPARVVSWLSTGQQNGANVGSSEAGPNTAGAPQRANQVSG